jgi:CRISPR system Cascade subunit CasB
MAEKNITVAQFVHEKLRVLEAKDSSGKLISSSRAMLARLRRCAGKPVGEDPAVFPATLEGMPLEWQSDNGIPTYQENAVHAALTLYALHQQGSEAAMNVPAKDRSDRSRTLGSAIQRLASTEDKESAVKRRFDAMATATSFAELAHHARGIVQLLRADKIPLDYARFAQDLYQFQFPGGPERIRLIWGQDYYRRTSADNEAKKETDNE